MCAPKRLADLRYTSGRKTTTISPFCPAITQRHVSKLIFCSSQNHPFFFHTLHIHHHPTHQKHQNTKSCASWKQEPFSSTSWMKDTCVHRIEFNDRACFTRLTRAMTHSGSSPFYLQFLMIPSMNQNSGNEGCGLSDLEINVI